MNIISKKRAILPIPISPIVVTKISDWSEAIMTQNINTGNLRNFGIQLIGNNFFIFIKNQKYLL